MGRLTVDLIQESLQHISPVGDYELIIRGLRIPVIENLGATLNQFDSIDLTDNEIKRLAGFPLLTKLRSLYLSNNRIKRISRDIPETIPNLRVLILTNNSIEDLEEVDHLFGLKCLWMLSLMRNPVAMSKSYRLHIIHKMPQIRVLDFKRVTLRERQEAAALFKEEKANSGASLKRDHSVGEEMRDEKKLKLTAHQMEQIRCAIDKAEGIEEIDRLSHMLNTGEFFLDELEDTKDKDE
ncbi:hypothetical protein ACOME3_005660 [Neoechinorhynchus agilis]